MKYSLISIALLIACAKAQDTRYCWSKEEYGYECCPDGTEVSFEDDEGNSWGVVNEIQCGIREGRCWSMADNIPCCPVGTKVNDFNQDGEW
ncbi:hypothetical protein PIROE2DRAFT_6133 [Piromyces sp. E2]|nr:hypothetical protein PIROE2DRAFT_6133 [Piromyces sp. E2]|eukprot:OUM66605.1 hypothetical protein PIROE2DRAFT_6133 [Piromyces sp. E2]